MIRRLTPHDLPAFRDMQTIFATAFDDAESYASAPPSDAYVRKLLADQTFIALIAEEQARVTGALAVYVLTKFEQERREIYIYDLAVDAQHRRRGTATKLIRHLQHIAVQIEATAIFVQADVDDPPAIALYESLGPREEVLHFDIPVRPSN